MADPFYTIKKAAITEDEIKKSRFIVNLKPVKSQEDAKAFIASVKDKHARATHNCWAFVIGDPGGAQLGMSDDGEPQGTAGRPMLSLLQNKRVGDVVCVVTRYSSGIKLGTGGLVRAYQGTLQLGLEVAGIIENCPMKTLQIKCSFAHEALVRDWIERNGFSIERSEYTLNVVLEFICKEAEAELKSNELEGMLQGCGKVTEM